MNFLYWTVGQFLIHERISLLNVNKPGGNAIVLVYLINPKSKLRFFVQFVGGSQEPDQTSKVNNSLGEQK